MNIDWAGFVVERISGLSLNQYFQKNIFAPLGIQNISFDPSPHMRENLVGQHLRFGDKTIETDHTLRRILDHKDGSFAFDSGGAGCFAKPKEYCRKTYVSSS